MDPRLRARPTVSTLVLVAMAALLALPASAQPARPQGKQSFEVWAIDQGAGLNRINVYSPALRELATIELNGIADTPHMIDFDSKGRYAFVANTRSGNVVVIRAVDRKVVANIPTGATAHMAAVTPDDSAVWVANIGSRTFTEIVLDLDAERFTPGRTVHIPSDPLFAADGGDYPSDQPVCHQYTADSRFAYLTLGPADGGLVVVDLQTARIVRLYDPDEVKANCGVALSPDGTKMYANWGSVTQNEGEWYVFDTATHDLVSRAGSGGVDAHGVRFRPGTQDLWMLNRASSNAIIIDGATDEVVRELDFVGQSPDILDFSPDGQRVYITLRGPEPRSGAHAIAGTTPGFSVLDTDSGKVLATVQPARGDRRSDFHGIAVRPCLTPVPQKASTVAKAAAQRC